MGFHIGFKVQKNFTCIEIRKSKIVLYVSLNPDDVTLEPGFSRDVTGLGHWGTGDLRIDILSAEDFEKAKPLISRSYSKAA